jgi:rare lipoprotein A
VRFARPRALSATLFACALACALAVRASAQAAQASAQAAAPTETGVASWYGPDFHGKRTSNGEVYDKEKLTCAHRTLPFNSYVLVRDLDSGSSVVVRVNDRGPFAKDRVIDLSEAAARIIGMIPTGTARVSLTLIPKEEALAWKGGGIDGSVASEAAPGDSAPSGTAQASSPPPGSRVRIQVASYASEANARSTVDRLAASGLSASIERSGGHFRVVFPDLSPEEARLTEARLGGMGYRNLSVTTKTPLRN